MCPSKGHWGTGSADVKAAHLPSACCLPSSLGFSSRSCPNPLTEVQEQVPSCMHSTLLILHRTRPGCSCSKARNEVPHTEPCCPAWTNPTCFQFGKAELVAGARSSQDTPAAAWDRAHFCSCSSHSSTMAGLSLSLCCSTAALGVFVVIYWALLCSSTAGDGRWHQNKPALLTVQLLLRGLGQGRCENGSLECQGADTGRVMGIQQTLKGQ